jgi:hypothetical protein
MTAEIAQMVHRTGEAAPYYAALDLQHFGATSSASNFTDFSTTEEALAACWAARGSLTGDDREELLALGAEPSSLLSPDVCRYLLFPARGRLGLADVSGLPKEAVVVLVREKPGIPLSLVVAKDQPGEFHIDRPEVEIATAIVGSGGDLWTVHPGLPIAPRENPIFEMAGFIEGDTFSIGALVDPTSQEGTKVREQFARHQVAFPTVRRVKVPASAQ